VTTFLTMTAPPRGFDDDSTEEQDLDGNKDDVIEPIFRFLHAKE